APLHGRHERPAVVAGRAHPARRDGVEPVRVGKVGPAGRDEARSRLGLDTVPAELRDPHLPVEAADPRADDTQAVPGALVTAGGEDLHADADGQGRAAVGDAPCHRLTQSGRLEGRYGGPEGPDPRHHDPIGPLHLLGGIGEGRVGPDASQTGEHRGQVRRPGGHHDHAQSSTPLVLGTMSPVIATASRRAMATALKAASALWWSLSPRIRSTWRAMRASMARLRRKWTMFSVARSPMVSLLNGMWISGQGRPERSTTARASDSSRGT